MRPRPQRPAILIATAILALTAPALAQNQTRAAALGRALRAASLDPAECYRVLDLEFSEEDAQFYLTSGYLVFGKPVNGAPVAAVFSADTEGGDAEVLLLPPDRSERRSLATFTRTPNLDEHFSSAIFLFTGGETRALLDEVRTSPDARKMPEIGALLAEKWNPPLADIVAAVDSRIVLDLLAAPGPGAPRGFFDAIVEGRRLGNFDIVHDPRSPEQIAAGQATARGGIAGWNTWTSFADRSHRAAPPPGPEEKILSYRIQASLTPDLVLSCITSLRVRVTPDSRAVIPFNISAHMRATGAKIDGRDAEVYQRENLRGDSRPDGEELLLVVPPQPLEPGSEHEVEIRHEGKVAQDTGHRVYFVSDRGSWVPDRGAQFATYDVTWRYPNDLDLVSAGQIKEDRIDGVVHITRRVTEAPVRTPGFNFGQYERRVAAQDGIQVAVNANREMDDALRTPQPPDPASAIVLTHRPRLPGQAALPPALESSPVKPADQLSRVADEVTAAVEFYRARFGPPPVSTLEVSPVPGRFGQGFAGMVYVSTLTYLPPGAPPLAAMSPFERLFYTELLPAHEVAHQWWGNVVTAGSYHHEWLMEALANYSALLFLESRKGPKFLDSALDEYRRELLQKGPSLDKKDEDSVESQGPVVQGWRLETLDDPAAWTAIVYGKGTWILHMLRRRIGDTRFLAMLAELRRRYEWQTVATEEFRALCATFLPPGSSDPHLEDFFDQWVYGTGIPTLKLSWAVTGKPGAYLLKGTLTQTDAPDDLSLLVPLQIQTGPNQSVIRQLKTGAEPTRFSIPVPSPEAKVTLDPDSTVLHRN